MRLLTRLHRHRAGVPLDDLAGSVAGEELDRLLADLEQAGMARRESSVVRLTDLGMARMDEVFGKLADRLSTVTAGLDAEEMATLRHICLTLTKNQRRRWDAPGHDQAEERPDHRDQNRHIQR
jgi:hypothetical protein